MRFDRQLPVFGEEGQKKISEAHVAVAGCGGLGCTVIKDLALAGVRHFTIIDFDEISETDLNRQFIYIEKEGRKAEAMREWLKSVSDDISVTVMDEELTSSNVDVFLEGADIAVDCLDDNEPRLVLNKGVLAHVIPLVHGGVESMFGQVTTVIPGKTPCLGCILGKGTSGVIPSVSSAVSVVASIESTEVLKLITGKGETLAGHILTIDLENNSFEKIQINKKDGCEFC